MSSVGIDFNVAGIEFIVAVLVGGAFFFHLPTVRLRQAFLAAANLLVLWANLPAEQAGSVLLVEVVVWFWQRLPHRTAVVALILPVLLLGIYLFVLVGASLVLKKYVFLKPILTESLLRHHLAFVGISYMLFRQIHFLVDVVQGQIERPTLWNYWNYQVNLFAILAGPISATRRFLCELANPFTGARRCA